MVADGWEVRTDLEDVAIIVGPGTRVDVEEEWVTLFSWDGLAFGKTILEVEIAGVLPSTKPTNIQTRWKRPNNNKTKRKTHTVGTIKAWADVVTYIEDVSSTDLPLKYQIWQKGTMPLTIVKIVPKAFNPKAFIAADLSS